MLALFLCDGAVQMPVAYLLGFVDVREQVLGVDVVLVNFIEVFGHLGRHATKKADIVAFSVEFRVDGDEFEQHVDRVDELDAAPLGHGFLDGEHFWKPNLLLVNFLELRPKVEGSAFVGEHDGKFLLFEVIFLLDVERQVADEIAVH